MMSVGKVIKNYLKSNGISQTFVCSKINISNTIFNNMLNGKRKINIDEYERICEALDVPLNLFTDLKNNKTA